MIRRRTYVKMATCSRHLGLPYVMVCSSCEQSPLVCCDCIARIHRGHSLDTLQSAAKGTIERLRQENTETKSNLKEMNLDLQNCQTVIQHELKIMASTSMHIKQRRDLLKRTVDEAAEQLLELNESYGNRIFLLLEIGKQQCEDKVKSILEFENTCAYLEREVMDYLKVIAIGGQMHFPEMCHFLIPSVKRLNLEENSIDRKAIRKLFGREGEDDIAESYISHSFDRQDMHVSATDSVYTFDLYGGASRPASLDQGAEGNQRGQGDDGQEPVSDGDVTMRRKTQRHRPMFDHRRDGVCMSVRRGARNGANHPNKQSPLASKNSTTQRASTVAFDVPLTDRQTISERTRPNRHPNSYEEKLQSSQQSMTSGLYSERNPSSWPLRVSPPTSTRRRQDNDAVGILVPNVTATDSVV